MQKNHEQLIVLDFDHTVFNTAVFLDELKAQFFKKFGIAPEAFVKAYASARSAHASLVEFMPYPDKEGMRVESLAVAERCGVKTVYSDARSFISNHQSNFDIIILTRGSGDLQQAKIHGGGLSHLQYVVVPTSKVEAFEQFIPHYRQIYFIDDHPENIDAVKARYPNVVTYQMRRLDDDPYSHEHGESSRADKLVTSLDFTLPAE